MGLAFVLRLIDENVLLSRFRSWRQRFALNGRNLAIQLPASWTRKSVLAGSWRFIAWFECFSHNVKTPPLKLRPYRLTARRL